MKMTNKNVYEALVAVNQEIQSVAKTGYNSFNNFKYAPIEEVYEVCREAMYKHGVVLLPSIVENTMNNDATTSKDKKTNYGTVIFHYQFYYGESKTEPMRWVGEATDTGDKTYSKAISFAQKTFLLTCFNIPRTDGDPDASSSEAKAPSHRQTSKPKFTKSATFYLDLFGRMDWTKKESPPKNRQYFKDFCKKFSINSYIVGWGEDTTEPEKMRLAIKTVSGLDIDYQTTLNDNQINKIKFAIIQMLEGGEG
jgi:hypothetical protein